MGNVVVGLTMSLDGFIAAPMTVPATRSVTAAGAV